MKAITIYLGDNRIPIVVRTDLSQNGFFDAEFIGGYSVGGILDGLLLRTLAVDGGYGVDGDAAVSIKEWVSADAGYSIGGDANILMLAYGEPISAGYAVGGSASVVLTRRRLVSEADNMLISEMDGMTIAAIDNITLE